MSETRKLAAILAADVVGYSRLAGVDEDRTLARLRALRSDLLDPAIAVHIGRVVKRTGDGTLVEFRSVVDAVRCAIEVQNAMLERNAGVPPDRRIEFRIGVHIGDIVEEGDGDLMGDGVNIAARLEGIAEPNGICLSGAAYEQVRDKLKVDFEDIGDKELKNIARPVRVYRVALDRHIASVSTVPDPSGGKLALPDKPSVAVLPFQNMRRRHRTGILRRRDRGGHHYRLVQAAGLLRYRSQFVLRVQRQGARYPSGRARAECSLCTGRQRTQGG
ncbi:MULTISPECIES: adenylate/guanylate cyclase domain-containing protein [unclassified Mesorhizobium]|uniref:adenylate/guanylate cyclase domain-containing protein n=1 Tax=unclassified Mesorhizobium TaxID=325217 RepID=UPI000F7593D7|nr:MULTISPECIES: adenylate/guanylate cyclase domain-containing protein [unclassified Mesorhizobium]AZO05093.1 adenylate/guanylate cyclase domain-containing protein [Mesorhizobium sp. M2A.F.Ca.ET.043.02.1.1]RWC16692.1 MAG: adenylate/guanylate cyclase domain-containing protein [Mesorhizobium sp.]